MAVKKWIPALAAASAVTGGALLLRSEYERDQLVTEYFTVHSPKVEGEGKRIVFLTDLHDKQFGKSQERLMEAIRGTEPDLVLVGGDSMVAKGEGDLSVALTLMELLSEEFAVIAANGNHELRMRRERNVYGNRYEMYRQELRRMGVIYLSDRHVNVGNNIEIYGMNLLTEHYAPGYPKMEAHFPERVLGPAKKETFNLLLAHSPMYFREYASWGADLTLAGHFHGGTIRLPFLGGVMTPQYQFFFPWCAGRFDDETGRTMIVGRGLGTHSINIRLNDKPQLVVVDIKR